MMKRLAGVVAGAALLGGLAFAQQDTVGSAPSGQVGSEGKATGTMPGQATGQVGVPADSMKGNQLIGTVVESKSHTLYLQHMGAVVPVRVDKSTDVQGLAGKKLTDLKAGDEVQVSFLVKNKIDNVATRIQLQSGLGGSGLNTSESSRNMGIGGSGAGSSGQGEDTHVGKPVFPDDQPVQKPQDTSRDQPTDTQKPIY